MTTEEKVVVIPHDESNMVLGCFLYSYFCFAGFYAIMRLIEVLLPTTPF